MLVIIWEYRVRNDHVSEFERIYSANGLWKELFQQAEGYLGTELLTDTNNPYRYITIDRWDSPQAYETFLSQWKAEYASLDTQCEGLTENEFLVGKWESLTSETR